MRLLNNFLYLILKNKEITLSLAYLFYGISIFVSLIFVLYGIFNFNFNFFLSLSNLLPVLLLFFGLNLLWNYVKGLSKINKNLVTKNVSKFVKERGREIALTFILLVVTIILLQLKIKFVTAAFALPIVFLTNLVFILTIFMKNKLSLGFLVFVFDIVLYYAQVVYLFYISKFLISALKKK